MPNYTDDDVKIAVASSRSKRQALICLGLVPAGGNYATLNAHIERLGLDTAHFQGQGWRVGATTPVVPARPLKEILRKGTRLQTFALKNRLLREGRLKPKCSCCGRVHWNGEPVPTELDHINGDVTDNRLSNLRILCPNCHAQTPTHRGLNKGRYS